MPYTTPAELARRQALIQNLRAGGPQGGYARNPLGALAQGMNAHTATTQGNKLAEMQTANTDLRREDMGKLVDHLRGVNQRDQFKSEYDAGKMQGPVMPESAIPQPQFEHPDISDAYTSSIMAQQLAKTKAATTASSNPYYTPVYTEQGIGAFNNRSGGVNMIMGENGKPMVRSTDDPTLQGTLAYNKRAGTEQAVTEALPGQEDIKVDAALEQQEGLNKLAVDHVYDMSTPEAEAATEKAVMVEIGKLRAAYETKMENTRKSLPTMIEDARAVLNGETPPTASGFGNAWDSFSSFFGNAPEGAAEAAQLKVIGGMLVSKMPRMEGPQSDFDVKNYREMAGQVGDPTLPISVRLKALETVEGIWMKWEKKNQETPETVEDIMDLY